MKSNSSFVSNEDLKQFGFKSIGQNVLISRFARFYGSESMEIGSNVRIDDFCILSGNIKLGSFIHISAYCGLYGKFGIELEDYSGLSPCCTVFSASDDFSGEYLVGPMVPTEVTNVTGGKVVLRKFVQIGAGTIILPDVVISQGVAVGALSLVRESLAEWNIYAGNPLKLIKPRQKKLLDYYEQHFKG
jgi:acetyltransferase-like isoleucine patch superfamily enzyme